MEDSVPSKEYCINILVARYGGGHYATYEALRSIIEQKQLPWKLEVTDVGEIVNQLADKKKFINLYNLLGTSGDEFYSWILQNDRTWIHPFMLRLNRLMLQFNYNVGVKIFAQHWYEKQPDLVISTLPVYNKGMWESLQKGKADTPLVSLMIDFADYPPNFWIEPETDNYTICGTHKAVEQARTMGVREDRIIQTSGMVIHPRFYKPLEGDRATERQKLGLDPDCLTGVVMFGGNGSKAMLEIAKSAEKFADKLQLIFLCGHNQNLATTLRSTQNTQKRFVTGFTEDVPYYMHLADFFVGKPGPGSISEALAMKLPVVVQRNPTMLVHERFNTEWVEQKQVGIVIRNFRDIHKAVEQFIKPETLARYKANVAAINNRAVFEIPDILQQILDAHYQPTSTTLAQK